MLRIVLLAAICLGIVLAILALSGGPRRAVVPVGDGTAVAQAEYGLRPPSWVAAQRTEAEATPEGGAASQPVQKLLSESPGRRRAAGRVLDAAGRPARADLLLVRPGGAQQRAFLKNQGRLFETDRDGRFFFECDSRGEFDLVVIDNSTGWVRVPLGGDAWPTDMEIRLNPLPYVRGRVVGPDGTPRVAVTIEIAPEQLAAPSNERDDLPPDLRRMRFRNQRPDGEGRFAIGPLAPGEYRLTVETEGPFHNGRWDWGDSDSTEDVDLPPPTSLLVRAEADPKREVLVRHNSTEVWIRWFAPASRGGPLVLNPWQNYPLRREAPPSDDDEFADTPLYLEFKVVSDRSWRPGAVPVRPSVDDGSATFAFAVPPDLRLNVLGIGWDVPLHVATVTAPFVGERRIVDIAVPARTRAVPVLITTVIPAGAHRYSETSELRRRGDRDGPGLPLRWNSGKPFDLAEGHYTLHLTSKFKLASGELETVEREVDLNLHGRDEFHTTVDFGP